MLHPALPQRLLVGVAPSRFCEGAARMGHRLGRRLGAETEWLQAVDGAPLPGTRARLEDWLCATLDLPAARLRGRARVGRGRASEVLAERAREVGADWVLVGPHAVHGRFELGSTALSIASRFDGAVWVQPASDRPLRRILVGTDLSDPSLEAVHRAHALAQVFGASLTVVHCFHPPEFAYVASAGTPQGRALVSTSALRLAAEQALAQTLEGFAWGGVPHELLLAHGEAAATLLELQGGHDLIAVGSHGVGALTAALMGSVARKVISSADRPVVVFRHTSARVSQHAPRR